MKVHTWAVADELISELGALRLSLDDTRTDPIPATDPAVTGVREAFDRTAAAIARVLGDPDDAVIAEARRMMVEASLAAARARAVIDEARSARARAEVARRGATDTRERLARREELGR